MSFNFFIFRLHVLVPGSTILPQPHCGRLNLLPLNCQTMENSLLCGNSDSMVVSFPPEQGKDSPPKFFIVVSGLNNNPAGFILIGHFIFPPVFQIKLTYNIFIKGGGHDDLTYICTDKGLPVWLKGHFKWVAVHTIKLGGGKKKSPQWEPYFCVFIADFLPKYVIFFFFLPRGPYQGKCLVHWTAREFLNAPCFFDRATNSVLIIYHVPPLNIYMAKFFQAASHF